MAFDLGAWSSIDSNFINNSSRKSPIPSTLICAVLSCPLPSHSWKILDCLQCLGAHTQSHYSGFYWHTQPSLLLPIAIFHHSVMEYLGRGLKYSFLWRFVCSVMSQTWTLPFLIDSVRIVVYKPTQSGLWEISSSSMYSQSFLDHRSLCRGCDLCFLKGFLLFIACLTQMYMAFYIWVKWNSKMKQDCFVGGGKNQLCCFEVIAKYDISRSLRIYTSKSCLERPNHTWLCSQGLTKVIFSAKTPFQITQP